jgi:hypothetical protein
MSSLRYLEDRYDNIFFKCFQNIVQIPSTSSMFWKKVHNPLKCLRSNWRWNFLMIVDIETGTSCMASKRFITVLTVLSYIHIIQIHTITSITSKSIATWTLLTARLYDDLF